MVLVGLLAAGAHVWNGRWRGILERRFAEYAERGEPVTWDDVLARRGAPPDEENSALVMLRANALLRDPATAIEDHMWLQFLIDREWGVRQSEQTHRIVRRHVDANAGALRLVREASRFESGAYPGSAAQEFSDAHGEDLAHVRTAAWTCMIAAVLAAESGDAGGAAGYLLDGRGICASLGRPPTMLEGAVRGFCAKTWMESVERTLALCELPPDDVAMLRDEAGREIDEADVVLAVQAARVDMRRWREEPLQRGPWTEWNAGGGWPRLWSYLPGWDNVTVRYALDGYDRAVHAASLPPRQRLREARELAGKDSSHRLAVAQSLIAAAAHWLEGDCRTKAGLLVVQTALAVEEYRLRHGRWPESLGDLAPDLLDAVPDDAYSDGKLLYLIEADGVVVYSVGENGVDYGGRSGDEAWLEASAGAHTRTDETDLAFHLLNPELRGARTRSFRDEVAETNMTLDDLAEAGFTEARLLELGFTEDDIGSH